MPPATPAPVPRSCKPCWLCRRGARSPGGADRGGSLQHGGAHQWSSSRSAAGGCSARQTPHASGTAGRPRPGWRRPAAPAPGRQSAASCGQGGRRRLRRHLPGAGLPARAAAVPRPALLPGAARLGGGAGLAGDRRAGAWQLGTGCPAAARCAASPPRRAATQFMVGCHRSVGGAPTLRKAGLRRGMGMADAGGGRLPCGSASVGSHTACVQGGAHRRGAAESRGERCGGVAVCPQLSSCTRGRPPSRLSSEGEDRFRPSAPIQRLHRAWQSPAQRSGQGARAL